jgi:catalase
MKIIFLYQIITSTGKSDPGKMQAFLTKFPESASALKLIKEFPKSSGFADATYNSLNAFYLQDAQGKSHLVRWAMVPVKPANKINQNNKNKNYLFDDLIANLQHGKYGLHKKKGSK